MTYPLLSGLMLFCLVSSITPGPNNLMLMAAGANFGVRRALPHAAGVVLGFTFMIIVIGLGAAQFFQKFPLAHTYLTVTSVTYLLYLAYKIGTAAPKIDDPNGAGIPITFFQATAFQWVNPKAWTMALAAITVYTPQPTTSYYVVMVSLIFGAINLPSISMWLVLGVQMRRFLTTPARLRAFNWTMASLLVLSLYPILNIY
jgi:threonine/homoserine/homoserine lactone efflux protein